MQCYITPQIERGVSLYPCTLKYTKDYDSNSNSQIMQHIEVLTGKLEGCSLSVEKLQEVRADSDAHNSRFMLNEISFFMIREVFDQHF